MDADGLVRDGVADGVGSADLPLETGEIKSRVPESRHPNDASPGTRDVDSKREDARAAYAAAVSLWTYEGDTIWARFNAMLVANSVILALIGLLYGVADIPPLFKKSLPIAGLVLCGVWLIITKRAFDYYTYWILSARELEEEHLSPVAKTISRGGAFAAGEKVSLRVGGKTVTYRMSWLGRSVRIAWCTYLVVVGFGSLYALLLLGR